jgi:hypothetical protein
MRRGPAVLAFWTAAAVATLLSAWRIPAWDGVFLVDHAWLRRFHELW